MVMDYDDYDKRVQEKLDEAMPWVGLYITASSTVCTLAMAADLINGFRLKKLWFPCKFFSINAASLTLLAVATKLPVDLNTNMLKSETDAFAQYMGLIFLVTALANFMTSLGSMNNTEILANVAALVIFAITVVGNVVIQLIELYKIQHIQDDIESVVSSLGPLIFMLALLTTMVSLAIGVPNIKRSLELKYQEKHKFTLKKEEEEGVSQRIEALRIDHHKSLMMKYLVMAETSSPQFVVARSVVCSSTASTFLFATIIILASIFITTGYYPKGDSGDSPYGNYTTWIFYVQFVGVVLGSIAPAFRLFVAISFKCSTNDRFKMDFKIENYWTGILLEWRDSFSGLQLQQSLQRRKYLHDVKRCILNFLIVYQTLIVFFSKLLLLLFTLLMAPIFLCFKCLKKLVKQLRQEPEDDDDDDEGNLNLSSYVLRLEGEVELPQSILNNICSLADHLIENGRKIQPQGLLNLLRKSTPFNGVGQFDSIEIPSLHSDDQEPPNCWTLPVITLTSIAIALPNIPNQRVEQLLSSVSEGLSLVLNMEKTLVNNNEMLFNLWKAADICWVEVGLYMQWLEIDLRELSRSIRTSRELLQKLSDKAEQSVKEFKRDVQDSVLENPVNWPVKVVAANSMYRISQTLLLSCNEETEEGLFERLSVMIADILAACLTNLPHAITTMCHTNAIEKREESVRKAFLLLGKTEEIVELLQQQVWPLRDHEKAASIDEWRALFRQNYNGNAVTSSDATVAAAKHLGITIVP